MHNNGFISQKYLKAVISDVKSEKVKTSIEGIRMFFQDIKTYIEKNRNKEEYSLEEYIDDFIISCVGTLFNFTLISDSENSFILYSDSIKEKPAGTLYALHYTDDLSSEVKGENFGYLAVQLAKKEKVRWAFLTNGLIWRIYDVQSVTPYESYLEMNLTDDLYYKTEISDDAKVFSIFCQAKSFFSDLHSPKSHIETYFENSEIEIEKLEKVLKGKIEKIVTDISYGFIQSIGKEKFTDSEKKVIFEDSLILLYRILFIQYAESRGLLPIENEKYAEQSFEKLAQSANDLYSSGKLPDCQDSYSFWKRVDTLRGYINAGWDDIDMKAYNGGLFDNGPRQILKNYAIPDAIFAEVICDLSYIKSNNNSFEERIEYKDLSVRHLGSLYEGLLEFNLFFADEDRVRRTLKGKVTYIPVSKTVVKNTEQFNIIKKGEIYLSQDASERKESGSYYTPEDVVNYIIENTIGKKLEIVRSEFNEFLIVELSALESAVTDSEKRALQNEIDRKVMSFVNENVLSLSILDSAMGSGHFLVNALYYLSNFIIELVNNTNWVNKNIPSSIQEWKLRVVSSSIYGVDKNPLSVHLGKLSLWLVTASKNKPLSFIDHHIKVGNSLVGTYKNKIENNIKNWLGDKHDLFTINYELLIDSVINKYKNISELPESNRDEVHLKMELYNEILNDIRMLKKKFDLFLSMIIIDGTVNKDLFTKFIVLDCEEEFKGIEQEVRHYLDFAETNSFFHWELEYPDVMMIGNGFDFVIGNPPYADVDRDQLTYLKRIFNSAKSKETFALFIEQSTIHLTNHSSYCGLIVPMSITSSTDFSELRDIIINSKRTWKISSYDRIPDALFGANIRTYNSILLFEPSNESTNILATPRYRWFTHERKELFNNIKFFNITDLDHSLGFAKIGSAQFKEALHKLFNLNYRMDKVIKKGGSWYGGELALHFKRVAYNWLCFSSEIPPITDIEGNPTKSDSLVHLVFNSDQDKWISLSILNSLTCFCYWLAYDDAFHVSKNVLKSLPVSPMLFTEDEKVFLYNIGKELEGEMKKYTESKLNAGKRIGNYNIRKCRHITDQVDLLIAKKIGMEDTYLSDLHSIVENIVKTEIELGIGEEA